MWKLCLIAAVVATVAALEPLKEEFAWKEVSFAWPSPEARENAIKSGDYIPENNLPLGLDRWKNKLFVTVPRWKAGVAASLNYITIPSDSKSPSLTPYPDWKANALPGAGEKPENNSVVSTFRVKADSCDRLWVMDTGLADILGKPNLVAKPAIVVFDLNTDKVVRRYQMKETDMKEDSFFANIVVDIPEDKCDQAFAYVPDLGDYGLVVYSWAKNDSWRVKHNFFHFDPLKGDFNIGGVNFQWTDGVFGLALGKPAQPNGDRLLYFHALASIREFSVPTSVLQNETAATSPESYYLFKLEGNRGDLTQASASDFDEQTNVLFLTQLNRDGVGCWNPRKPLNSQNFVLVAQDREKLVFTNDIKIDHDRNLWILSDRMPSFIYGKWDPTIINYRIFKVKVDDAIKDTVCA